MPSFTFLLSLLLFLTTRGRAETVTYTLHDNDLQKHCSFDLNGYMYDLCPLMGLPRVVEVPEQTSARRVWRFGSGRYEFSLGGLAKENDLVKLPGPSCNEDTQVCLTGMDEHGVRSTPLINIQKSTSSNLIISIELNGNLDHDSSTHLQVAFRGAQNVDVIFICSEVEKVDLIIDRDDKLRFMWASRYGCPGISTRRRKSEPDLNTWTSEDQDQEESGDDQQGDDELLPSDNRKARTGIAFVIVFIILSVISCSALVSSARARHFIVDHLWTASSIVVTVLSKVGLKLRPMGQSLNLLKSKAVSSMPFRRRDDNLMRWAWQEEMALDSDVMVNGSGAYYQVDEDSASWEGPSSEYIPLATGPGRGKGRRIQSYGSTHERGERGVLSRLKRYLKM